jgi:hypothetical protein
MLDRFDDRSLEITTVIVVVVIALIILCYLAVYLNPQVFFNPFKPPTPTLVAETSPFEPTWTPTPTPTETDTPTATTTWTPSPTATDTPTPLPPTATDTPTPLPPTATSPPKPTKPPPPPTATPTPTPWPYYYLPDPPDTGQAADCGRTWVEGWVYGANGLPEPDVQMRVGNDLGLRTDVWTDVDGYYVFEFAPEPTAGKWFVRVFKGAQPRSVKYEWQTSAGCGSPRSIQWVRVSWQRRK